METKAVKDIVLIPCFKRPEFLAVCLEYLVKAEFAKEHLFIFLLDYGFDKENLKIIDGFQFEKQIVTTPKTPYTLGKQSHNLLEGYRLATTLTDGLIYLIEDDIMMSNDFFKWHRLAQQRINFCTVATANNNTKRENGTDLEGFYQGAQTDYQSLGVCWQSQVLKTHVLPHANTRYYSNPITYCTQHFTSIFGEGFAEQDGLIRRIKETLKLPILFAEVPRAFHAGFIGYNRNRGKKIQGNLINRINFVRNVTKSAELMRQQVERPEFYEDSKPINLTNIPWDARDLRIYK